MKNVLVTGATGFLGRTLVPRLEGEGFNVTCSNSKNYNLLNYENLLPLNSTKFEYIFHLAANTKAGDWCLYNSGTQWWSNTLINANIVRYWSTVQPQAKLVVMGTSCSYDPDLPLSEEYYTQGDPDQGLYYYAQTKRAMLDGLRGAAKQNSSLKWLYFIPSTLYGPNYEPHDNHFIFDLVRKLIKAKKTGESPVLWGDGNQKRELIHVEDAVDLMMRLLNSTNEVFNLGRGEEMPIRQYANVICEKIGFNFTDIEWDPHKYVGVLSKCLSIKKVQDVLGDIKYTPLEKGIQQLVNFESKL